MCLYPKKIYNKKYMINEKNGGIIPAIPDNDHRVKWIDVGCGKCMECMKEKCRNWQVRLLEDIKENTNGKFVTLTYSEEALDELSKLVNSDNLNVVYNEVARISTRRFLERWRKKHKKSVRHWLVTERGQESTERIHLHGIIWTDIPSDIVDIWNMYGHVYIGEYVNSKTVNYIVKYLMKQDSVHTDYVPRIFTSSGIGKTYLERDDARKNEFRYKDTRKFYRSSEGFKMAMPKYYKNKLWSDDEREQLWRWQMDEEVEYILGQKVCVKDGGENASKLRKHYDGLNRQLGFRGNEKIEEEERYKEEMRKIRIREKLKKENN